MKVYIASPYTKGDVGENVNTQLRMFNMLAEFGFTPYAPLWAHFQHVAFPRDYEFWLDYDLEWLRVCDCVLRLAGESTGADREVAEAQGLGIPVFYNFKQLSEYYDKINSNG